MSKFEELKRKAKDQVFCGIAKGIVVENVGVKVNIDGIEYFRWRDDSDEELGELIEILDKNWEEKHATAKRDAISETTTEHQAHDEVDQLIKSRSNGTYDDISDTASEIIKALGTDSKYTYFFSQIANKLARIKNGYSVEDSLLDIAGYAKLELEKERKNERK